MSSTVACGPRDGCTPFNTPQPSLTWRSVTAGLLIGSLICCTSVYYGLQSGNTNSLPLPAAFLGYVIFRPLSKRLSTPFSLSENVLVMAIASAMGGIPYTAGITGIVPALEHLVKPDENGPLDFNGLRLIFWCFGVSFIGIAFAAPFRRYFVSRPDLPFPTGSAIAVLLGMLYRRPDILRNIRYRQEQVPNSQSFKAPERTASKARGPSMAQDPSENADTHVEEQATSEPCNDEVKMEDISISVSVAAFALSGAVGLITFLFPQAGNIPLFGLHAARTWALSAALSPAYMGYGMIMLPMTVTHIFLGAVIGWGILSPIAKLNDWAPGPTKDWETGVQGWVIWVALGSILGDSTVGLCSMVLRVARIDVLTGLHYLLASVRKQQVSPNATQSLADFRRETRAVDERTSLLSRSIDISNTGNSVESGAHETGTLSSTSIAGFFVAVSASCLVINSYLFGNLLHVREILLSISFVLPLGIASIRAMGETDNGLASTLGKIPLFFFALIIAPSNPNAILISLIVGGIAEGATYQSSDLMEHMKTGWLAGSTAPKDLFYGQLIGSLCGSLVSSGAYKLITSLNAIPGDKMHVPTAQLWLATAHLAYGQGLPPGVLGFAVCAFVLSSTFAVLRLSLKHRTWSRRIPSGVAMGLGIYTLPQYTLPQCVGALLHVCLSHRFGASELSVISVAVGLILGQSLMNVLGLILQATGLMSP